jgi:hypothetical protein
MPLPASRSFIYATTGPPGRVPRSPTTTSPSGSTRSRKYWPESAVFIVEDDSQADLDHVDGHRAPIRIISPLVWHGVVDNTYFAVAVSEDRNCKICVNYHLSAEYPDHCVYGHLGAQ